MWLTKSKDKERSPKKFEDTELQAILGGDATLTEKQLAEILILSINAQF